MAVAKGSAAAQTAAKTGSSEGGKATTTAADKRKAEGRDRFKKMLPQRMDRACKVLDLIANCGNRTNYTYTDAQATQVVEVLQGKIDKIKKAFSTDGQEAATGAGFQLVD